MVEFKISKAAIEYSLALSKMQKRVEDVALGKKDELIWFLEHKDVFTAGTSANVENEVKNLNGIPIIQTGRGGKITYHGKGQRIVYLILDLKKHYKKIDLKKFVYDLEQIIINSLLEINVKAFRIENKIGIWVKNANNIQKIAAIGIRVKKSISMHGFAINISTNLEKFNYIIPCGISEYGVASLKNLGIKITMHQLDDILLENIKATFNL
jgi:lipoyl(octanoyl) transferase